MQTARRQSESRDRARSSLLIIGLLIVVALKSTPVLAETSSPPILEWRAEYYANSPDPIVQMERSLFEQHNAHMQEMGKLIQETNQDAMMPYPVYGAEPALPEDVTPRIQEMEKQSQDYRKAAEERRAAFMKEAEQRRLDAQKRIEERRLQHGSYVAPVVDVPKPEVPKADAKTS